MHDATPATPQVQTDDLIRDTYRELRALAASVLSRAAPDQSLQPTALVHEAYLRLLGKSPNFENRRHFFFAAARAMHDIIVERARQRATLKRGQGRRRLSIEQLEVAMDAESEGVLALDAILSRLEREDREAFDIIQLRFFGGLSMEETAEVMGIPLRTLERRWRFLRAMLHRDLSEEGAGGG
ncbi:hypothetical protein PHYC_00900 [Phycisphaerales bacterium]|nr:hypothetical protein PHYC_00900 [Phycisphaerales bacterium]